MVPEKAGVCLIQFINSESSGYQRIGELVVSQRFGSAAAQLIWLFLVLNACIYGVRALDTVSLIDDLLYWYHDMILCTFCMCGSWLLSLSSLFVVDESLGRWPARFSFRWRNWTMQWCWTKGCATIRRDCYQKIGKIEKSSSDVSTVATIILLIESSKGELTCR